MKMKFIIQCKIFLDILRKHPGYFNEIGEVLLQAIDYITEPESKVAMIWILGEFGENIDASPYILENFVISEEN